MLTIFYSVIHLSMRISQLRSLTDQEYDMLLYIVNVIDPVKPPLEVDCSMLLCFRHDMLVDKVLKVKDLVKEEFQFVFNGLVEKLNKTWIDEIHEYANTKSTTSGESEFQI